MSTPLERFREKFAEVISKECGECNEPEVENSECLCDEIFAACLSTELSLKEKETIERVKGEYLMAFGSYVPLGYLDIEPKVMAQEVARLLEGVVIERVREWANGRKIHQTDDAVIHLSELLAFLDTLTNEKR